MKKTKDKVLIDATKISLDEWLNYVYANEKKDSFLFPDCCFPTDEMKEQYIKDIDQKTDKEVKFLLSKFLISGGRFNSDDDIKDCFFMQPIEKQQQLLNSFTYYQRLISLKDWNLLWPSITWIVDLLPSSPYDAINAINSYYSAHCLFLTDHRADGISDAISLIEAKYISHKLPIRQILLDIPSRDFELLTAYLYNQKGYKIRITPRTRDGGYDVLAIKDNQREYEKLHIECKRYTEKVGVQIIRGILGTLNVENATKGVIITTSDFTKTAYDEAKKSCRLELININEFDKDMRKNTEINWIQKIPQFISEMKKIL